VRAITVPNRTLRVQLYQDMIFISSVRWRSECTLQLTLLLTFLNIDTLFTLAQHLNSVRSFIFFYASWHTHSCHILK
jgi:hypothetical protein